MRLFRYLALVLFIAYLGVLPGSMLVVALDRVPAWGEWMGGALLIGQGAAVLCWLLGAHGWRGALAALLVFGLAWGVEHAGVTTGAPFGHYAYTPVLQPQLLGVVPLAIACAWVMVALGAWQIATYRPARTRLGAAARAATLVLLLDLQIETVATKINPYWVWHDSGAYYGVPLANFVAWWLVGLGMALVLSYVAADCRLQDADCRLRATRLARVFQVIPAALYCLSTLMFTVVNLARGYELAGLVGAVVLAALGPWAMPGWGRAFQRLAARDVAEAE